MKKIAILVVVCVLVPVAASAQLLMDQTMGAAIGGGRNLGAAQQGVSSSVVLQRLKQQGYSNVQPVAGNPQQYIAMSPAGIPVTLTINVATGQVLAAMPR